MTLHETIQGGVATIVMDNPPVNALGIGDTYGLAEMLDGYRRADDVRAVVLTAEGRGFCAGVVRSIDVVDICLRKFGKPVYVKHQIVHNPHVVADLERKGAITVETVEEVPEGAMPLTECLADVVVRLLPYWEETITPDLAAGQIVLISAHGNSLRALCKHLDRLDDDAVTGLNIPTGTPLVYELDGDLRPIEECPVLQRALDPEAARIAAEEVGRQAG